MNGSGSVHYSRIGAKMGTTFPPRDGEEQNAVPRFFADAMLGRLARWLRLAGCDVAYRRAIADAELVAIARAEGRVILTRDLLLVRRRWAREHHFLVAGDDWRGQFRQVVHAFAIDPAAAFLTRCLECNEPLVAVARDAAAPRVPAYVAATRQTFRECPACGRIYWKGTHRERMEAELAAILDGEDGKISGGEGS